MGEGYWDESQKEKIFFHRSLKINLVYLKDTNYQQHGRKERFLICMIINYL